MHTKVTKTHTEVNLVQPMWLSGPNTHAHMVSNPWPSWPWGQQSRESVCVCQLSHMRGECYHSGTSKADKFRSVKFQGWEMSFLCNTLLRDGKKKSISENLVCSLFLHHWTLICWTGGETRCTTSTTFALLGCFCMHFPLSMCTQIFLY